MSVQNQPGESAPRTHAVKRDAPALGGETRGVLSPGSPGPQGGGGRYRGTALRDGAFIALAVALSVVGYVAGLGFYSDDWTVVGYASVSADQSFFGIFQAIYGDLVKMRP